MSEMNTEQGLEPRTRKVRHQGRASQIPIYLGKQLRFFVNQSDWKVLPMAAIIAALVGMVIRKDFFVTMEGSLKGAFALTCVGIWNGAFNSIQAVCRERPIIKREHRSGMHISSYIIAHMIYQLMLCLAQTGLTMYVLTTVGVKFPAEGFMTSWMILDIGISLLLVSYASDMMSLFISSVSHTTTGAMTVMPFVLIFQLVFAGGLLPLPDWTKPLASFTISNYGIKAMAANSGYNESPMVTAWKTLDKMRNNEIGGTVTLGQIMDLMDSKAIEKRRDMEVIRPFTVGEVADILNSAEDSLHLRDKVVYTSFTLREILTDMLENSALTEIWSREIVPAVEASDPVTLRELVVNAMSALLEDSSLEEAWNRELVPATEETEAITLRGLVQSVMAVLLQNDSMNETWNQEIVPAREASPAVTAGDLIRELLNNEEAQPILNKEIGKDTTLGQVLDALHAQEIAEKLADQQINPSVTLGEIVDFVKNNSALQAERDREITFKTTIAELFDLFGEENIKTLVEEKTAAASHNADYERSFDNIFDNWFMLFLFILAFAGLSTIFLEFIDKDKR